MAKRKRDDADETKGVNDKEENIQRTVKWLCLHPLWSLRKDVLGNPNLLRTTASFLELKDQIALGKSHKSANRDLLKGDRGEKLKETATRCCLCKKGFFLAQTFFREVEEFKAGYYCADCMPTKCDGCNSHYKFSGIFQREEDDDVYCEGCYDNLPEEEDEEEEFECEKCGCMFAEEDMDGELCNGCAPPREECKSCGMWYAPHDMKPTGFCSLCDLDQPK